MRVKKSSTYPLGEQLRSQIAHVSWPANKIGADREARWHPSSPSGWLPLSWPPHGASSPAVDILACKLVALLYLELGALPHLGGESMAGSMLREKEKEMGVWGNAT